MFGGDNNNQVFPVFLENNWIPYNTNALPQLQFFGDFSVGCSVGPSSHAGNEHTGAVAQTMKRSRGAEAISRQQNYQRSSIHNFPDDQAGQSGSIQKPNIVSTGLKLSYEEDEHNSSVTSMSENMTAALPIISYLGDNIKVEIDRQKVEFDHYIKLQEENMLKGARELNQRHTVSFLSAIENGARKKLHEKELQIENMKLKNKELVERIKQVSAEVQSWHYKAKYNESVVSALRNNLKQVTAQGVMHVMEGCGDSEVDDAASYTDQKQMGIAGSFDFGTLHFMKNQVICRSCKVKEVCILLLPCRHLCLCRDCGDFINVCPVCQVMKTASVEVHMS